MLTPDDRTALAHLLDVIRSGEGPALPDASSLGCSSCAQALRVLDGLLVPLEPAGVPIEQIAAGLCTVCRAPREPHETGYLKGDHEFVPPEALWRCGRCSSTRWVTVSLDGGQTARRQCVRCGWVGPS